MCSPTSFTLHKKGPFTTSGRPARKAILASAIGINRQAGMRQKNILSNLMVKSKSSRQPETVGPKESSSRHFEKPMIWNHSVFPSGVESDRRWQERCYRELKRNSAIALGPPNNSHSQRVLFLEGNLLLTNHSYEEGNPVRRMNPLIGLFLSVPRLFYTCQRQTVLD